MAKGKGKKKKTAKSVLQSVKDAKKFYRETKKKAYGHVVRGENEISKFGKSLYKIFRELGIPDSDIPKVSITNTLSRLLK